MAELGRRNATRAVVAEGIAQGGGTDSPLYAWVAETLRSLLPQLAKMEILFGEPAGIETLESRLREAVVAARSQIGVSGQICAWART
jgi:hypothetical protein